MGKLRTIAQDAIGLMGGHCFGWKASGIRTQMVIFRVKIRIRLGETIGWKSAVRAPSLHVIP
jgi:hypothetical protein